MLGDNVKKLNEEALKFDIIEFCSDAIVNKINSYLNVQGLEYEKLKLGVDVILLTVSKLIITLILAAYFKIMPQVLSMIGANMLLKNTAFGLHSKSSFRCLIITLAMFILPPTLLKNFEIGNIMVILLFTAFSFLFYMYAPADTANHPLLGAEFRKKLKYKTVFRSVLLGIITVFIPYKHIKGLVSISVLYTVVGILPVTYKVLKRRYNNYEQYE